MLSRLQPEKSFLIRSDISIMIQFLLITTLFIGCNEQVKESEESNLPQSIIHGELGSNINLKLTPYIENIVQSHDLPGLAIGIVQNNEIVYANAFGYMNMQTQEPLTISSMFHMASISKPFVATAIMQLVEQGKVDLDSAVIKYLPYFRIESERYDKITVQQMLSHSSGMPDVEDYQWDAPVYSDNALELYVKSLSSQKLHSVPGENFGYSNMAFECLGALIATVSGKPFADYVKQHILNSCGMKESTFLKPTYLPENWASPHIRTVNTDVWNGYPYNRMHGPSSTLHSNVLEMCNWAITNISRGSFSETKILDQASYDLLWDPWVKIGENSSIGLSWFLDEYRDEQIVKHSGGDTGFSSNLVLIPEKFLAVVVMCNLSSAPVKEITNTALDMALGFDPVVAKIPASITVSRELETNGVDAAVARWDSLQNNHAERYNFQPQQFSGLFTAIELDHVEDAENLTRLCLKIFPEEIKDYIKEQTDLYIQGHPNNQAAPAMMQIIVSHETLW